MLILRLDTNAKRQASKGGLQDFASENLKNKSQKMYMME